MTWYPTQDIPKAHLIEAKHRECLALSAALGTLMLIIQANFGAQELHRIQQEVYKTLEAENAVS